MLFWLLVAGLSLYSLHSRGALYSFLALGGAFSLFLVAWVNIAFVVLFLTGNGSRLFENSFVEGWWVYAYWAGFLVGGVLLTVLGSCWQLPRWLVLLMPVRGIYARRMLSAISLVGVVGPLLIGLSLLFGPSLFPQLPPIGVLAAVLICASLYAPLWDVAVHWHAPNPVASTSSQRTTETSEGIEAAP
jgi:hypothetical protein